MRVRDEASRWTRQQATVGSLVLALGTLGQTAAAVARSDRDPSLSITLALIYLAGAILLFVLRDRITEPFAFLTVPLMSGLLLAAAVASQSDVIRALNASILVGIGAYAAWYFGVSAHWRIYIGVFVAGCAVSAVAVIPGSVSRLQVGWSSILMAAVASGVSIAIARLRQREQEALLTDSLTGTLNRRGLQRYLDAYAARRGPLPASPTSVIALDLDDFKLVNDRDGHAAGDVLLGEFAHAWRASVRSSDAIARIGGDEFAVVLPGTAIADAHSIIARAAANSGIRFSAGVALLDPVEGFESALAEADALLYQDKERRKLGDLGPAAPEQ